VSPYRHAPPSQAPTRATLADLARSPTARRVGASALVVVGCALVFAGLLAVTVLVWQGLRAHLLAASVVGLWAAGEAGKGRRRRG
jgi:hypothetical protein